MYSPRGRSPSYSPPRGRSPSYAPPRARSSSYSPPRAREFHQAAYESRTGLRRSRSRSKTSYAMKRGRSPPYSPPSSRRRGGARSSSRSRSRSRTPQKKPLARNDYSRKEYDETLRTLHCKDCNVYLHDRDSMVGHLQGREHLMQQKRMRDNEVRLATGGRGLNDMLRPDHHSLDYDESYWHREDLSLIHI